MKEQKQKEFNKFSADVQKRANALRQARLEKSKMSAANIFANKKILSAPQHRLHHNNQLLHKLQLLHNNQLLPKYCGT